MVYLDNSATSRFKPQQMIEAMAQELKFSTNSNRGIYKESLASAQKILQTRDLLKDIVGANDEYQTIFTSNCTEALNLGIFGYINTLNYPINVVTTVFEHNSTLRPLYELQRQKKITMTVAFPNKAGVINAQQLEKFVSPQTKMLVINCTSNVTGNTCDLASIGAFAKKNNMVFLLDTAQALGHISIDASLNNIDMLAIAGHKGLHGPQGIGALVVKNDINLKPIIYGGNGVSSSKLYMPLIKPEAYECGTLNTPAIIGLKESLIWTKANLFNIKNLIDYLAEKLWVYLAQNNQIQLYSPSGSNVIAFNVKNFTSSEVGDFLNQNDIAVRAGLHCAPLAHNYLNTLDRGAVRVSIGYNNDIRDINLLINALDKLIETSK